MKFNLQDLKKVKIENSVTRNIKHDELELTLEIKQDEAFQSAFAKVAPLMNDKTIGKNDLKRENQSDLSNYEMLLYVIGEYCVKEWNATDENDNAVPINGDNFLLVLNAIPNLQVFIANLLTEFGAVTNEFAQQKESILKKPSTATNGKSKKQS